MTRPRVDEVRFRDALINSHGGVMREKTAKDFRNWLADLVDEQDLQMLRVNEVTDRVERAVISALGRGWEVERRHDRPGSDEVLLAVRKTFARVEHTRSLPMGGGRWRGAHTGRLHTPRQMLEVRIAHDLVDFFAAVVHAPPGVDVEIAQPMPRRRRRRLEKVAAALTRIRGKADRVLAWRLYWRRFRRWAAGINRLEIPWTAGGDVQEPRSSRGWTSPADTAARVGGKAVIRGIDGWLVGPGVRLVDVEQLPGGPGMDHDVSIGTHIINLRGAGA